ncbi:MAG TPA: glutaredoxin domain-containing protein [Pseudomonadales bacterium]|nr:glutaredoxin domain-containing protein [Pseudomonadales bacterium]
MKIMLAALLILISCTATAEIYKWTDKNGVAHYEDQQPEKNNTAAQVETVTLKPIQPLEPIKTTNTNNEDEGWLAQWMNLTYWMNKAAILKTDIQQRLQQLGFLTPVITNETIAENQNTATNKAPAKPNNVVEIYTAAWCGVCKKAKRWLNDRNIAYKEYDIEKDSRAAARMQKLGGSNSIPFAVINGKPVQGFSPDSYQAAIYQ